MFDVLDRITELRNERGWTLYRVAKNAGIPQSTLSTWYAKRLAPPVDAIEKMCTAFDITLAEFFEEKENNSEETNLAKIRKQAGISQEELANKAGVSVESICAYEQRKRDISKAQYRTVERMAKALDCTMEKLVDCR